MQEFMEFVLGGFCGGALVEIAKNNALSIKAKVLRILLVFAFGFLVYAAADYMDGPQTPRTPSLSEMDGTWELGLFVLAKGQDVIHCTKQRVAIKDSAISGALSCTIGYNIHNPTVLLNLGGTITNIHYDETLFGLYANLDLTINDTPAAHGLALIHMNAHEVNGIGYHGSVTYNDLFSSSFSLDKISPNVSPP